MVLRMFDTYVSCSIGLPRSVRTIGSSDVSTNAPQIDTTEMLLAANANVDILGVLGDAVERMYFKSNVAKQKQGANVVERQDLEDLQIALDRWAQDYPTFSRVSEEDLPTCSKCVMRPCHSRSFY